LRLPMMLPGFLISTSPSNFHPIRQMQLQRIDGERWALLGTIIGG
jgi:branched-chain amino acid transport system substrate-binding protein